MARENAANSISLFIQDSEPRLDTTRALQRHDTLGFDMTELSLHSGDLCLSDECFPTSSSSIRDKPICIPPPLGTKYQKSDVIQDNFNQAMKKNPHSFVRTTMLYVECKLNGHKLRAFVDTGAQSSVITPSCAMKCGNPTLCFRLSHLINRQYSGVALGVGSATIHGRVASAEMDIGGKILYASFVVISETHIDLMLGLDILKAHKMSINLRKNYLRISPTKKVQFMSALDLSSGATQRK